MNFYIQWDFTNLCNLKCKHCYKNSDESNNELNLEDCLKICDIINLMAIENKLKISLSLTGGEPFTRKKDLYEILDYIENKTLVNSFQILTNGLLIDLKDIKKLKSYKKLNGIQISLESSNKNIHDLIRGSGTFDKTIEQIKKLVENNLKVHVMMTISKKNKEDIEDMYKLLNSLKVYSFSVDRFIPETSEDFDRFVLNKEEYEDVCNRLNMLSLNKDYTKISMHRPLHCLLDENKGGTCSAGKLSIAILPNGDLLPCRRLKIKIGNILKDGIINPWNENIVMRNLRSGNLKGKCKDCEYKKKCGGCRAMAYAVSKDYLEEDPICWKGKGDYNE